MPNDLGAIAAKYKYVMIPELNSGQFNMLFRAKYLIDTNFWKINFNPYATLLSPYPKRWPFFTLLSETVKSA